MLHQENPMAKKKKKVVVKKKRAAKKASSKKRGKTFDDCAGVNLKKAPVKDKPERRLSTGTALHIVRAERRDLQELVAVELHCFETGRLEHDGKPLLVLTCVPDLDMVKLAKEAGVDVASVVKDVEAWKRIYPGFEL
jgi:hypothetical protein